jgi:hypothetical protein
MLFLPIFLFLYAFHVSGSSSDFFDIPEVKEFESDIAAKSRKLIQRDILYFEKEFYRSQRESADLAENEKTLLKEYGKFTLAYHSAKTLYDFQISNIARTLLYGLNSSKYNFRIWVPHMEQISFYKIRIMSSLTFLFESKFKSLLKLTESLDKPKIQELINAINRDYEESTDFHQDMNDDIFQNFENFVQIISLRNTIRENYSKIFYSEIRKETECVVLFDALKDEIKKDLSDEFFKTKFPKFCSSFLDYLFYEHVSSLSEKSLYDTLSISELSQRALKSFSSNERFEYLKNCTTKCKTSISSYLGEDWEKKYSGLEVKGKIIFMKTFFPKSSELSIQEISNEQSPTPPIGNGQLFLIIFIIVSILLAALLGFYLYRKSSKTHLANQI